MKGGRGIRRPGASPRRAGRAKPAHVASTSATARARRWWCPGGGSAERAGRAPPIGHRRAPSPRARALFGGVRSPLDARTTGRMKGRSRGASALAPRSRRASCAVLPVGSGRGAHGRRTTDRRRRGNARRLHRGPALRRAPSHRRPRLPCRRHRGPAARRPRGGARTRGRQRGGLRHLRPRGPQATLRDEATGPAKTLRAAMEQGNADEAGHEPQASSRTTGRPQAASSRARARNRMSLLTFGAAPAGAPRGAREQADGEARASGGDREHAALPQVGANGGGEGREGGEAEGAGRRVAQGEGAARARGPRPPEERRTRSGATATPRLMAAEEAMKV